MLGVASLPLMYQALIAILLPLPYPRVHDEFSNLLGADTLLHGRFANPTPPLTESFETVHELMRPSYASKYPIGQAASLAAGRLLFGHPFWGVVFVLVLAGAVTVWTTRLWAGPLWALISGIQMTVVFGMNHYWARSYWGGGLAFLGAMLVIGGYRALSAYRKGSGAWPLAIGLALLFFSRPYEGGVLGLCVVAALLYRAWRYPGVRRIVTRRALPVAASVLGVALLVQARVNHSVTGSFVTMPYVEHQHQYETVPVFWFQPLDAREKVGTEVMRDYREWIFGQYQRRMQGSTLSRLLYARHQIHDALSRMVSLSPALLLALCVLFRDRLPWFLVASAVVTGGSLLLETLFYDHYAAPFVAVIWVLQFWIFRQLASGTLRPRITVGIVLFLLLSSYSSIEDDALLFMTANTKQRSVLAPREAVERTLQKIDGRHLVIVRRRPGYGLHDEWVYNGADIENAEIIWARDLGNAANARLFDHFRDRMLWLCEPENTQGGSEVPAITRIERP
jgi:hypothetical protein